LRLAADSVRVFYREGAKTPRDKARRGLREALISEGCEDLVEGGLIGTGLVDPGGSTLHF
jgi:hypothetical protein